MNVRYLSHIIMSVTSVLVVVSTNVFAQAAALPTGKPQTGLPHVTLKVGRQQVRADVASTDATRQIGLMFRQTMGRQDGMLFVFPEVGYHAMWMKNTLMPLAVAYMNERGVILSIHEMQPLSETAHQAAGPARYALEMNAGWFGSNKINVGDTVKGLDKLPKPR